MECIGGLIIVMYILYVGIVLSIIAEGILLGIDAIFGTTIGRTIFIKAYRFMFDE